MSVLELPTEKQEALAQLASKTLEQWRADTQSMLDNMNDFTDNLNVTVLEGEELEEYRRTHKRFIEPVG